MLRRGAVNGTMVRGMAGLAAYLVMIASLLGSGWTRAEIGDVTALVCVLLALRHTVKGKPSPIELSIATVAVFLFAIPAPAIATFYGLDLIPILLVFAVCADLTRAAFSYSKNRPASIARDGVKAQYELLALLVLMFWCAASGFYLGGSAFIELMTFTAPYGLSLLVFERLLARGVASRVVLGLLACYAGVVLCYITFFWTGYGRLVIGTYILMPVALATFYSDTWVRLWQIPLVAPVALYFAQESRYGEVSSGSDFLVGSAGHHLIITKDLFGRWRETQSANLSEFFDQFILFFLNWTPRGFWPEKPLGVGFTSVDILFNRRGLGEDYTHSLGFIGEQVYLLAGYWLVGLSVLFVTICVSRYLIRSASGIWLTPVVIFDINLISFFWGGSATFGSRAWFMLLPPLAYIVLRRVAFARPASPLVAERSR